MPDAPQISRSRLVQWEDPAIAARAGAALNGLEILQAMIDGKIPSPPISHLLNFHLSEAEVGRVVFTGETGEFQYNPMGMVHGGVAATMLDSAMACSILSTLPQGIFSTTVELHINMVRPLFAETGRLICSAEIIHVGKTVATAQGRLTDATGKLYAHGTITCMILRP
ncbi:MAG: PaaI family thioesterase [Anaerolineae bacterium]|nr:PaaI family thioesterase [Anaerolineae bacterium]